MKYIRVSFFNFIEKNDRIWLPSDFFGKLSALLISHISRGSSHQPGNRELFHIFAHIYPDQVIGSVKKEFCQYFCQLSLTYSGRTKENKCTNRLIGILKTGTVTLNSFYNLGNSLILADNTAPEFMGHLKQSCTFCLSNSLDRDSCHHGNNLGYLIFIHNLPVHGKFLLPFFLFLVNHIEKILFPVAEAGSFFKILILYSCHFFLLGILKLLFK